MTDKPEIPAQPRDIITTIDTFMAVVDEYADKTTKYNMPKIYGGSYLYRDGIFSDPQAEYMEELRKNINNFKQYIVKFMQNHPEIPISAEDTYWDGGFENPNEHHHPGTLKIVADFPNKKNEIAQIAVTHGDYRGVPTIKMVFGKRTLYDDRFGKKYEEEKVQKRIAESFVNVHEHINKDKNDGILNASPIHKIIDIPLIAKAISWLSKTKN